MTLAPEQSPAVGRDAFTEVVPEQPVLQPVTGAAPTGAALCRAGADRLAFTGSSATGRRGRAACAEAPTPVLAEVGGESVDDEGRG